MSTRRRGWTYSLRTLLLVVTAAALYLGSQLQTVAARREALRELEEKTATIEYGFVNHKYGGPWPDARLEAAERRCRVSALRGWMGDRAVGYIELPWKYHDPEKTRFEKLFPEADIELFHPERH